MDKTFHQRRQGTSQPIKRLMSIRYLTIEEIIAIHQRILEEIGGRQGIRDLGLLFASCEKPKMIVGGMEVYDEIFIKTGVLLEALANYHPFVDGNKRTAFLSAKIFLRMNGYILSVATDDGKTFLLEVATKQYAFQKISQWIKTHTHLDS